MDRALNGEEVPHYYHGELVGTSRRYDNRLAAWLLDNPWKVGRQQMAREYVAEGWDRLLERIEWANLDWEDGEGLPTRHEPEAAAETDTASVMPGEDPAAAAERVKKRRIDLMADDQDRFIGRSWYASRAEGELARGPRGGARR
jgi:hypothetical protein